MKKFSSFFIFFGTFLTIGSLSIFFLTFFPIISLEFNYNIDKIVKKETSKNQLKPVDENFGIIIPKIGANSKVISNVDPYNEREYQVALTKGVAHAKGTAFPQETGNIFIFSHSSENFYEAARYNSIFYLLNKMEKGDEIDIFYRKNKIKYKVVEKKIVDAKEVSYLKKISSKPTLTLMTCWPPGTTLKRLLVIAEL